MTWQGYFAFLGALGLYCSLIGANKRTGDSTHDLAAGYLAIEAWRWFRWIAAGMGALVIVDQIGKSLGFWRP